MPMPGFYICIRKTLDWHDEAASAASIRPDFRPKVAVWNATLDPPYHLFRHRLKQIAQANLARVENAVQAALEKVPRGALVIPVDDDDWLAPELANRLAEQYEQDARGYLWIRHVVEPRRPLRTRAWHWLWSWKASTCRTNNYAIPSAPELVELVSSHVKAGRYFDANRSRIKRLPRTLGIQNRNLSSQTAMAWPRPSISRDELVKSVARYRRLYSSYELSVDLSWARPYMTQMDELMNTVRVK